MKLSFDVCVFTAIVILCGAAAIADQAEHRAEPTTAVPPVTGITDDPTVSNTYVIKPSEPCQKGEPDTFLTITGGGKVGPIVSINECTGRVTVYHPEHMNQQAREFWRAVQQLFPAMCHIDIQGKATDARMHGKVNTDTKVTRTPDGGLIIKGTDSK